MIRAFIGGATLAVSLWSPASAEIVIGAAGPMTGQYAPFGAQIQAGAEMAVADINAAGGVGGQMLALRVGDDACDPQQAEIVARDMADSGAVFMAGHFCSGSSIPASHIYAQSGIVQISPASTSPIYTDERPGPGIYRVCGRDDQQGLFAGRFLLENNPDARIAFIHDQTAYGKGLADATMAAYEAAGGAHALYETFTAGERDYSDLIGLLRDEAIDIVYLGGYHTEAGLIMRQMRDAGMETLLVSGDALVTDEYWAITGDAGEGTLMTFPPDPRRNEAALAVVERFREAGIEPEGYVLYTYAAVQAWAQAAEAAGGTDHDAVVAELDRGNFDTVLGELTFDGNGDAELPAYVFYEWRAGTYDYLEW